MATKQKSRLGRGLSSLISVSELPVEVEVPGAVKEAAGQGTDRAGLRSAGEKQHSPAAEVASIPEPPSTTSTAIPDPRAKEGGAEIPITTISNNPHQPRRRIDEATIAELAASLKSNGLIQPIIVRKIDGGYQLIAGERRLRAARLAGMQSIPAIVRDVDSMTQAQMALVENIQREDLNPIDRAQSYRTLLEQLGLTQAELASRLGEDRSSVANFLRLLDLAEPVRELVRDGKLTLGHAKILAGVDDILEQQRLANLVVAQELSVRNLERLLQAGSASDATPPREPASSAHLLDLEKSIARQLGMRVQLRAGARGRGRLVIHYASLDQFDELLARMNVRAE